MQIREISLEQSIPLRAKVLRPHQPLESSKYPQDPSAVHFGCFTAENLMSTVTTHPEDSELFAVKGQWRIRGMATEPAFQGFGYGGAVLHALLAWGRARGISLFWCNAREGAIRFYERHGFSVASELFEISGIGPHKIMKINL